MPTLFIINGIRFFFYNTENNEPIHIHVTKAGAAGKVWLEPVIEAVYFNRFTRARMIIDIVQLNFEAFKTKWNEYFSK